ncbi:sugar ABC transporter permease [Moorella naiadis]|uniref:carbohydrate ABC transporter permease n=1 Tax=Moorella naiadis (nom. illeg.) TaxID=3093670 RepID=UPI003D9C9D76
MGVKGLSRQRNKLYDREQIRVGYTFLSPVFLWMAVFVIFPVSFAFYLSLHDWNILSAEHSYVGLGNYLELLRTPDFLVALKNTIYFTAGNVFFTMVLSLIVAVLLNRKIRGIAFLRGLYYSPVVVSVIAAATVWTYIYDPQFGTLNSLLRLIHLPALPWLADPAWAMPAVIIMSVWKNTGYYMVIYLAGLQGIPESYHEAAKVDGATPWQCFWYITWPLLMPSTMLVVIMALIHSFQVFGQIYVMTAGGPVNSTLVLVYYLYQQAFVYFRMGYASAVGFVIFIVIFIATFIQFRLMDRKIQF